MSFELVQDHPRVYVLRVPLPWLPERWTNVFLVRGEGEDLLIDAGSPGEVSQSLMDAALRDIQVSPHALTVFLTHLHVDHAGLAGHLAAKGAKLVLSEAEYAWMQRLYGMAEGVTLQSEIDRMAAYGLDADVLQVMEDRTKGPGVRLPDCASLRLVREGDAVVCGGIAFEVLETPGHSPGHALLFNRAHNLLFVGDHVLSGEKPMLCNLFAPANTHSLYVQSLQKVRRLGDCVRYLQSHGEPVMKCPLERVDWLIENQLLRLEQAFTAIKENPGTIGLDAIRSMRRAIDEKAWNELRFGRRYCIEENGVALLDQLTLDGRVVRSVDAGGLYRYRVDA